MIQDFAGNLQMKTDSVDPLLTIEELANILKVSPKTIYNWTYRNMLPYVKLGRRALRFRTTDIQNWIAAQASA